MEEGGAAPADDGAALVTAQLVEGLNDGTVRALLCSVAAAIAAQLRADCCGCVCVSARGSDIA